MFWSHLIGDYLSHYSYSCRDGCLKLSDFRSNSRKFTMWYCGGDYLAMQKSLMLTIIARNNLYWVVFFKSVQISG